MKKMAEIFWMVEGHEVSIAVRRTSMRGWLDSMRASGRRLARIHYYTERLPD